MKTFLASLFGFDRWERDVILQVIATADRWALICGRFADQIKEKDKEIERLLGFQEDLELLKSIRAAQAEMIKRQLAQLMEMRKALAERAADFKGRTDELARLGEQLAGAELRNDELSTEVAGLKDAQAGFLQEIFDLKKEVDRLRALENTGGWKISEENEPFIFPTGPQPYLNVMIPGMGPRVSELGCFGDVVCPPSLEASADDAGEDFKP